MKWTSRQWVALTWVLAVCIGFFLLQFIPEWVPGDFWFILVAPFVIASLLGIWLTAGMGPVWLRMLSMLVGQSLLIWIMAVVSYESPVGFTPGLAATTAFTAVAMLGLGCLGSILPIQSTWSVRIALWEIVVSVGLIGVSLAIIRLVSELYAWDWPEWASRAGVHFLVFALYTGLLMTLALLPLIVKGRLPRGLAVIVLLAAIAIIPPIESLTFLQLDLDGGDLDLFYAAHTGQIAMALAIMIPLVVAFPGFLVRQTRIEVSSKNQTEDKPQPPTGEQDFADMQ
ncbi:hypothetical protein Pan97_00890 [Bremerella volcania]|uniref:Uncharacterized protein n=1 Tax=Bremerella volcania TaxID=2527984 RepID=A0A518C1L9_9BACT|nr:hypothetical protein [Bremerella volcania]QDU73122.1 hypothetical protein Pan97_00890 [Bremerella volcania]